MKSTSKLSKKRSKVIKDKPLSGPLPQVNRNALDRLLCPDDNENLREVSHLMSKGLDNMAARLASSMSQEGHPAFPYRLEAVAKLAASLVRDGGFAQAAKDAVALLNACKAELSEITVKEAWDAHEQWRLSEATPGEMNFTKAARYVTKKTKDELALKWFKQFLKQTIRVAKTSQAISEQPAPLDGEEECGARTVEVSETTDEELMQWIEDRSGDISGPQLRDWRQEYLEWRSLENSKTRSVNGKLGGRGRKNPPIGKKVLTEKLDYRNRSAFSV